MTANSIRERLILSDIELLSGLDSIKTITRVMQSHSDLADFALTQLPVAAVVGRLPQITNKFSRRNRATIDQCSSRLSVDIYVYFLNNENSDIQLSDMLEEIWKIMNTNPTRGSLCLGTTVDFTEQTEIFRPYGAFKVTINHDYIHDLGGI